MASEEQDERDEPQRGNFWRDTKPCERAQVAEEWGCALAFCVTAICVTAYFIAKLFVHTG